MIKWVSRQVLPPAQFVCSDLQKQKIGCETEYVSVNIPMHELHMGNIFDLGKIKGLLYTHISRTLLKFKFLMKILQINDIDMTCAN